MRFRFSAILAIALLCVASTASWADLGPYNQDFEGLTPAPQPFPDPFESSLADDGWLLFVNVFDANGNFIYNYGNVFPAPNHGEAISAVVVGEGGPPQGERQVSIFSDYFNGDHAACGLVDPDGVPGSGDEFFDSSSPTCRFIEVNVFQEQVIAAADLGTTWRFDFDYKRGNIEGATTALAFFKVINPFAGFSLSAFIWADTTDAATSWDSDSVSIFIDPSWEGQILQFGFLSKATAYEGSGVFYDNVSFGSAPLSVDFDVKPGSCPNPINPRSKGVLPVAVLGTMDFDVNDIDVDSLQLEGVSPINSSYEDVAEPYMGDMCGCTEAEPDGWDDLTLKFKTQEIVEAIGSMPGGDIVLTLTGTLLDGTPIEGQDCVIKVGGGQGRPEASNDWRKSRTRSFSDGTDRRELQAK